MKSEKIASDVKVDDITLDIFQNSNIIFSSSYTLFLKRYADLIDDDLRYPVTYWNEEKIQVVYCTVNNAPIAFVTYYIRADRKVVTLDICYVNKDYRNKGIFKLLLSSLGQICKTQGIEYFVTEVPIKDNNLVEVFQQIGFKILFNRLHKKVQ